MTTELDSQDRLCMTVIAASPAASLATLSVASTLGIGPERAAARLNAIPSVLADDVPAPVARRLRALLATFGVRVRLDPTSVSAPPAAQKTSVSVQLTDPARQLPAAEVLAGRLGWPVAAVTARLSRPGGVILNRVEPGFAARLQDMLTDEPALTVLRSDPQGAVHDVFADGLPGDQMQRLLTQTGKLGLAGCDFSGAVAAGLNHATATHLVRQMAAGPALIALDRAFQRFDLWIGLAADPAAGRARPPRIRVERGLGRAAAEHLAEDYARMGVVVRPRLSRPCADA